jgi:hypothetical protein
LFDAKSEAAIKPSPDSMGYYGKATVHGLRGTTSTILNEYEFNSDWIELQSRASRRRMKCAHRTIRRSTSPSGAK